MKVERDMKQCNSNNPQGPIHSLVLNSRPGKASKGFQWQQHFFTLFGTLIGTKLLYVVGRQMYLFIEAGNYFILKFVCQMHTVIYLPRNTVEYLLCFA